MYWSLHWVCSLQSTGPGARRGVFLWDEPWGMGQQLQVFLFRRRGRWILSPGVSTVGCLRPEVAVQNRFRHFNLA